jgi:hypothetical protein
VSFSPRWIQERISSEIGFVPYELPLDFEVRKHSVFNKRKKFILEKVDQARSLAERVAKKPRGTNFDVSWAKSLGPNRSNGRSCHHSSNSRRRSTNRCTTKRRCRVCYRFIISWTTD